MNEITNKITRYVTLLTGEPLVLQDGKPKGVPLALTYSYTFMQGEILGTDCLFAFADGDEYASPAKLARHAEILKKAAAGPVIFIFEVMPAYNRTRLIAQRVNFIVPGKQMFLPDLMLDLGREKKAPVQSTKIPSAAQFLLLYHLEKRSLDGLTGGEISRLLHIPAATVSRAVAWLEVKGVIEKERSKTRPIHFLLVGKVLWEKVEEYLVSPVIRIVHSDKDLPGIIAGENALAAKGMLAEADARITAVSREEYRSIKEETDTLYGTNIVEVWKYDPAPLSEDGVVDRLSLYLSLKNNPDERIQKELKNMMEEMTW